ncbi:MAG: triose-phosphate isomerase [Saprospiraceae bacterium]|nr:triose-phosphate isomerase [Saprospiraceae bacterium]
MKRQNVVAGNWKMNKTKAEVREFVESLRLDDLQHTESILSCAYPFLTQLSDDISRLDLPIMVSAQNCSEHDKGAFTGEVSAGMIRSTGATRVIIGHSERRQYYNETDEAINAKIKLCLEYDLVPILCVGETLQQRSEGEQDAVVIRQLSKAVEGLSNEDLSRLIIAYEPVWAIGTGETASADQAQQMHRVIRSNFPGSVKEEIQILYGGSVKPANFRELLAQPDIDGGLIGGASLNPDSFSELIDISEQLK